jgi:hypothetical protein
MVKIFNKIYEIYDIIYWTVEKLSFFHKNGFNEGNQSSKKLIWLAVKESYVFNDILK